MRHILLTILLTLAVSANAQTEPEYRLELGAGAGMVTYLGDFNGNILKNPMPMFSVLAKFKANPRMAVAMNVSYGNIKGSAQDAGTYMPTEWQGYSFNHSLLDVGFRYEYNFWPYGTGMEYRGAKRLTPYIYIGIGMTFAKPDNTYTGINMPLGGGIKYKAVQDSSRTPMLQPPAALGHLRPVGQMPYLPQRQGLVDFEKLKIKIYEYRT